jgi:cyclopropane fatty-acyl-phospholipid synthase-like methyltransferase
MTGPDDALEGQRRIWTIGDYPAIARHLRAISLQVLDSVGVTAGQRVLDVGVGDGNTAIEAAARGGVVAGIDHTRRNVRNVSAPNRARRL